MCGRLKKLLLLLFLLPLFLSAQDKDKKFSASLNGYVKQLQIVQWLDVPGTLSYYQFIHNRLNSNFSYGDNLSLELQMRNRLFSGENVRRDKTFASQLEMDPGLVDMAFNLWEEKSLVLNSNIDRLSLNYSIKGVDISVGRQRINWGKNLVWNPNDIFNAYNFLDFDYEERPGTDAVRVQLYPSALSRIDVAVSPSKTDSTLIAAALYAFNLGNFDVQVLGGQFEKDLVAGMGWSGNLGDVGTRGEISYFHPQEKFAFSEKNISFSTSLDYFFEKGTSVGFAMLYNDNGIEQIDSNGLNLGTTAGLNAKNLFPSKYSFLAQTGGTIKERSTWGFAAIYSPKLNLLYAGPSFEHSIHQNWELGVFYQGFWLDYLGEFQSFGNSVFARIRWNF